MEILARSSDWTQIDEENLAKFLETETGKRLIPQLTSGMPILLAEGETNAILIRTGEVRAYQAMVEHLVLLAHPLPRPPGSTDSAYPPLEDDRYWKDGQSLEQNKPPGE